MPRQHSAYIIEVGDVPPPFANNANHRTIYRDAPSPFGIDKYRATAMANLVNLHDNLEESINRECDGLAAKRAILQQVRLYRDATMAAQSWDATAAAQCDATETAAITALYNELMAEYSEGWPTTTTGMVVRTDEGGLIHITVRVYVVTDE